MSAGFVPTGHVARMLGVPENCLQHLIRSGAIPPPRIISRRRCWTEADVDQVREILEKRSEERRARRDAAVERRLMGLDSKQWVPTPRRVKADLVQRCRTMGQKAAIQVVLDEWQQQQRERDQRAGEPLTLDIAIGGRRLARLLDVERRHGYRLLKELVDVGVLEDTGRRGGRGVHILRPVLGPGSGAQAPRQMA